MSCSIAMSNSPVFSPSSSLFLNKSSVISSPAEAFNLTLAHLKTTTTTCSSSTASISSPYASGSATSSPSSPFRLRLPKTTSGLSNSSSQSVPNLSLSSPLGTTTTSPNSTVLKRKRPARLDVPVASLSFPALATPSSAMRDGLEVEGDGYSVFCKRGRRESMEDRYSAAVNLQGKPKEAFFGVYDGHGGSKAAEFAAQNLEKNILSEVSRRNDDDIEEAVKQGYLTTDSEFLKADPRGGTCCVTAFISNGNLIVSNAGDCRAVICRGGVAEALTSDHRPSREDERNRIETLGGYVDLCHGVWRIQGSLAVSRGIGDQHLKQWVIAEPETKIIRIEESCEFLILASDGLWDKVGTQEAVDIARPWLARSDSRPEGLVACKRLADLSIERGAVDDISVMLIQLSQYI